MEDQTQVLTYFGTRNIGDAVQTVAMSRLLSGKLLGVRRDDLRAARPDVPFVVNGWLGDAPPSRPTDCLFAGVFIGRQPDKVAAWVGQSKHRVGVRDPVTQKLLADASIASDVVGCATLTFDRYAGPRRGRYCIDVNVPGVERMTNRIGPLMPWPEQWDRAVALLDVLRRADLVYTKRMHVVLPCLAFGTPVCFKREWLALTIQPQRLAMLDWLGFPYDEVVRLDVGRQRDEFVKFLSAGLGRPVTVGQARRPE